MRIINEKAIVVGFEEIDFDKFPNLKVVGCNATSTEHIDDECAKRGIKVISLRGETEFLNTITSTAEHTMGLILALSRNYKASLNTQYYKDRDLYKGHTLSGKSLLLIGGDGRIGRQVQKMAKAFGMQVAIYEKHQPVEQLHELLQFSDVVSVHIPLLGNEGFFQKGYFSLMKPTSFFINTSRLGIVESGALLWALKYDIIFKSAVDFTDDLELVKYAKTHDNLILTPHCGGNTFEDRERTEEFIIMKVNQHLHNVVSN